MRPDWDDYFLGIAEAVSKRGDCIRRQVGAVLVFTPKHWQLAQGYNGSPPGGPSCLKGECPRCLSDAPSGSDYDGCIETHAEENCLEQFYDHFGNMGRPLLQKSIIYLTCAPCVQCTPLLQEERIRAAIWPDGYLDLSLPKMS